MRINEVHSMEIKFKVILPQSKYDEELFKKFELKSKALQEREAKLNRKSNYRINFTKMTNKPLSTNINIQFDVLEEEFGFNSVRNMIEYMRVSKPGIIWNVDSFFNYLLKALQGRREQLTNSGASPEDNFINNLTVLKKKDLEDLKRENKLWI